MMIYDNVIIGSGVIGSAIARELSRYIGTFCVLEKNEDVCTEHLQGLTAPLSTVV